MISNNGTSTENISLYLDYHLKLLVPNVTHILEETRSFLNCIPDLSESSILVSFDVAGLYPHIQHEEGIKTMAENLETREDNTMSTRGLCDLASIVVKENYFELGKKNYHQKLGAAIGTKFALPFSNIFLVGLQKRIFETSGCNPYLHLRFLDDIFCI